MKHSLASLGASHPIHNWEYASASARTNATGFVTADKVLQVTSDDINISNYYEGDALFIRIELDDDGSGNKDIIIWSVAIAGVKWTHGERIT